MTGLTYSSGEPIRVGDTVRRSRTVQRMIEDDKLTPERKLPGPNGAYLIPLAEVERVLAERAA